MNILALDHGKKRIGLAWMQGGLDIVLPYGVIEGDDKAEQIAKLIEEERIDKIVVGLPLSMESEENENTKRVRDFVQKLSELTKVPVEFVDERFTSKQADAMGGDASRDEKAAMVILQTYKDSQSG